MINSFLDALKKSGFEVNEEVEAAQSIHDFCDLKYPFGINRPLETAMCRDSGWKADFFVNVKDLILSDEKITVDKFNKDYPLIVKDSLYDYIVANIDKVRIISKYYDESVIKSFVGYFEYSRAYKELRFIFVTDNISEGYSKDHTAAVKLFKNSPDTSEDILARAWDLLEDFDFIPIVVDDADAVIEISNKAFVKCGVHMDAHFYPVLGEHILNTKWVMDGLKEFLKKGGYILPNNKYIICNKWRDNPDTYYLKWLNKPKEITTTDLLIRMAISTGKSVVDCMCEVAGKNCITDKYDRANSYNDLYNIFCSRYKEHEYFTS